MSYLSDSDSPRVKPTGKSIFHKYPLTNRTQQQPNLGSSLPSDPENNSHELEENMPSDPDEQPAEPQEEVVPVTTGNKRNKKVKEEKKAEAPPVPAGKFQLPDESEQPKVWVLVGSCGSGKSHFLKSVFYQYAMQKHFKFGLCYTATKFTGDYGFLPDRSIREWDEEHFKGYLSNLKKKTAEGVAKNGTGWKLPHNFVIFDDNNGILSQSEFMINFISTHRHTRTTVFICSQLLTARGAVSTTMRANTSFALMWPTNSRNALKGLYENFGGAMEPDEFKRALNQCRQRKYSCLVLKNAPDNETVEEMFCTITAATFPETFQLKF